MNEVEIKFEREDLAGLVAVGTYLSDAARRIGIELRTEEFGEKVFAVVTINKGGELLSAPTKIETELLSDARRERGERSGGTSENRKIRGNFSYVNSEESRKKSRPKRKNRNNTARILKNCRCRKKSLRCLNSKASHSAKPYLLSSIRLPNSSEK